MLCQQFSGKTDIDRDIQNSDIHAMHTCDHDIISQPNTVQTKPIIDNDDDALAILVKHTTLTEIQKMSLGKD